jgi:hypothetical protein
MAGSPKKRAKKEALIRNLPALIPEPQEYQYRDRWGNPRGKFRPEFIDQARVLCEEGMTDKELAKFFGINKDTLYEWQYAFPAFGEAMKLGKSQADDRMERTAYEVAMGYTTTITETVKLRDAQGNEFLREYQKEVVIPPNPHLLMWMLKNRRPDTWRDKTEQGISVAVIHLTPDQARERLKAKLEELRLGSAGN